MKYFKPIFFIILMNIIACSTPKEEETKDKEVEINRDGEVTSEEEDKVTSQKSDNDIFGYYVGNFKPIENYNEKLEEYYPENKITISIDSLDKKKLILHGHSIVAGNKRPFKGKYELTDSGYVAKVKEPGNNTYDGEFEFTIKSKPELVADDTKLEGTWKPYKKNASVVATTYSLEKASFEYNPELKFPENVHPILSSRSGYFFGTFESLTDDVSKYNASTTLLKKEDIENMYQGDLMVIRNAIYARHGYSFKDRKMRFLFDHIDWYMPISVDIKSELTDIEKKNIELLLRYEEHAEKYYDTYGRG